MYYILLLLSSYRVILLTIFVLIHVTNLFNANSNFKCILLADDIKIILVAGNDEALVNNVCTNFFCLFYMV